jgi:hypothetical protein
MACVQVVNLLDERIVLVALGMFRKRKLKVKAKHEFDLSPLDSTLRCRLVPDRLYREAQ